MEIYNEPIFIWLSQFAFEPGMVYLAVVGMMVLSSIGFPLPEEVTLLSVGFMAFIGLHPDKFPPPYAGAPVVNVHVAAAIAFCAIFFSDFFIYFLGRRYGRRLIEKPAMRKFISVEMMDKVEKWTAKYGVFACGLFRFTPGIRFPGHLACGMANFSATKFALVDGTAALISVPTQIYLIAYYGEPILAVLKEIKIVVAVLIVVALVAFIVHKIRAKKRAAA
ncbi:MAG: DedA family protein [Bdellovibrionia bacterium]